VAWPADVSAPIGRGTRADVQLAPGAAETPTPLGIKIFTERTMVHAPIQLQPPGRFAGVRAVANCSTIRAQNAGRSSGQRLEVMFWSVTTSWSTTLPPALRMSVLTLG
jgi:hypothetical protein